MSKAPETPEAIAETFLVQMMVRQAFRELDPELMAKLDARRREYEPYEQEGSYEYATLDTRNKYNAVPEGQGCLPESGYPDYLAYYSERG